MKTCKRCGRAGSLDTWPRWMLNGRPSCYCQPCVDEIAAHKARVAEAKERGYRCVANTPEYKRKQREREAERMGREFVSLAERLRRAIERDAKQRAQRIIRADIALAASIPEAAAERKAREVRERYWKNREAEVARVANYKRENAERNMEWNATRSRRVVAQGDGTATAEAIRKLKQSHDHCHWCGAAIEMREKQTDHIVPLCAGGAHSLSNIVISCADCNGRKASLSPGEWESRRMESIGCGSLWR